MNKVWILTTEYNDYDQYGAYFLAWFPEKPTAEQLKAHHLDAEQIKSCLEKGGGRTNKHEYQWFHLNEEDAG